MKVEMKIGQSQITITSARSERLKGIKADSYLVEAHRLSTHDQMYRRFYHGHLLATDKTEAIEKAMPHIKEALSKRITKKKTWTLRDKEKQRLKSRIK